MGFLSSFPKRLSTKCTGRALLQQESPWIRTGLLEGRLCCSPSLWGWALARHWHTLSNPLEEFHLTLSWVSMSALTVPLATQVSNGASSSCGCNLKKTHMFPKHKCALIPFNSPDSMQLFWANGCYFSCKIACKYNGSYNGKWTNTFLSTSEMGHLSSGLCTESWHQMISFISFTVKLNLSQAPNCWEHEWRVSFPPDWEWKGSWLAGLPLNGFNLCGAWLKWKLMAVSSPNTQARCPSTAPLAGRVISQQSACLPPLPSPPYFS